MFSRRFPRDVKGSPYPVWEEVYLSKEEEREIDEKVRQANIALMKECLEDAQQVAPDAPAAELQRLAIALFEKRSSHAVYWKEERTKEKFDKAYASPASR